MRCVEVVWDVVSSGEVWWGVNPNSLQGALDRMFLARVLIRVTNADMPLEVSLSAILRFCCEL